MSLRFPGRSAARPQRVLWTAALSALLVGACGVAFAATGPSVDPRLAPNVQNYAEQAVPVPDPSQQYYNSPLAAGTLTLEDVLEAHKPNPETSTLPPIGATPSSTATAPLLTPPPQESSTSLMMSQGMRSVLQKVGETSVASPTQMRPPSLTGQALPPIPQAQGQPASLLQGSSAPTPLITAPQSAAPAAGAETAPGFKYEPGQEPKNLAAMGGAVSSAPLAPVAATVSASPTPSPSVSSSEAPTVVPIVSAPAVAPSPASSASPLQSCDQNVQKWEKSCGDAGYPSTYIGKIIGETHSGCADGALHDVWVSNTCAPPDASSAQTPSTDGACGAASNNQFDNAPTANLCAQGIPSAVSGDGPWTWACSGVNGGQPAACVANIRVTPVNGVCGAANGEATWSAPTGDLCASGTPTLVRGRGPWTWSCRGVGAGSTQSCIAVVAVAATPTVTPHQAVEEQAIVPVTSAEHALAPASPPPVAEEAAVPAPTPAVAEPQAELIVKHHRRPVQPDTSAVASAPAGEKGELCGAAAETLAYEAPDRDLCRAGTASAVNGEGPWTWSCTDNEGRSSSCRTLSLSGGASAPAATEAPAASESSSSGASAAASIMATAPAPHANDIDNFVSGSAVSASSASNDSQELACGAAALQAAPQAPTDELCVNGTAGAVKGSGPWHWTCSTGGKGHRHKISCETPKTIDGRCGPANGTALKSTPFSGLCSVGVPTGIEGNGPWAWTCSGIDGGISVSCAATIQGASSDNQGGVSGTCGSAAGANMTSAPTQGLCSTGSPSAVSGQGPWTWSCSGANGGSVSTCLANKSAAAASTRAPGPSVNGLCGEANGVTASAKPVEGLCVTGTVTAIVGDGPWNWSCLGENGGMTVSCTAPLEPPAPIDGVCGAASGVPTGTRPQSALCASGITGTVSGHGPWTWTCSGANGGSPSSCVAPVIGKSAATPSLTTSGPETDAVPTSVAPSPPPALVTPRLKPSKAMASPPVASSVPSAAAIDSVQVPGAAPDIAADTQPVPPPAVNGQLVSSADLQETEAEREAHIPGNHLNLDPTISTILFTRGSGNIDEQVISTLDKLAGVLDANPDVRITLTAYADNSDSTPRDARRLSLTRALAVRDYLASKGIEDSRVDIRAEGANTTSGYIDRVDVSVNN